MSEEIAIVCTVAELPDYGTKNDTVRVFTANFSVAEIGAQTPASDLAKALLQPWLWRLDNTIALYLVNAQGGKIPAAGDVLPVPSMAPAANPDAFKLLGEGLRDLFADTLGHADPNTAALFAWLPSDPGTQAKPVKDPNTGNIYQPWSQVLGHVSTYPAPLPQRLNLVVFFSVPKATLSGYDTLFVAPTFQVTFPVNGQAGTAVIPAPASTPVGPVASTNQDPNAPPPGYSWEYKPVINLPQDLALKVHQTALAITLATAPVAAPPAVPAAPPPAPKDGTLDVTSFWIKPLVEDGNEDWRTTLEIRASETFDLGRQVITALQQLEAKDIFGGEPSLTQLDQLRNVVVALLRDTVDMGLRFPPDRYTLLQYVLERISATSPVTQNTFNSFCGSLTNADQAYDSNSWIARLVPILTSSVPALQTIIPPDPGKPLPTGALLFTNANYGTVVRALSDLQKLLTQDTTIATILFSEWGRVLGATNASTQTDWNKYSGAINDELNKLAAAGSLRKRMLLANLGGADNTLLTWMRLIQNDSTGTNERQQIRDNLQATLMAYYDSRFGVPNSAVNDANLRTPALPSILLGPPKLEFDPVRSKVLLAAQAAGDILPLTSDELPPPVQGVPPPQPPPDPSGDAHPAVLRVSATAAAASATNDPLRNIAGVGMLLRQVIKGAANAQPWSCLTVATLRVTLKNEPDDAKWPVAARIGFIPHRLTVRNGLLQAALSYKSRPLGSGSPDDAMSGDLTRDSLTDESYDSLIESAYAPDTTVWTDPTTQDSWAHIPGLKYGASYDAAAFIIRNSGALPRELTMTAGAAVPGNPPNFLAPIQPLPPAYCQPPAGKIANFQYRRRTPVGHLRFVMHGEQDFTQNSLPTIPSTVAPLAREVDASAVPTLPAHATPDQLLQGVRSAVPLLLQWDPIIAPPPGTPADQNTTNQYTFKVRPPATSFHVWNRWVSLEKPGDPDLRWTRAAVYADTKFNAPKDVTQGQQKPTLVSDTSLNGVDLSINDAAVIALCFTLTPLCSPSQAAAPAPPPNLVPNAICVPISSLTPVAGNEAFAAGVGLPQVQGNYIPVIVKSGKAVGTTPISFDGTSVNINIPAGEVWKLTIAPAIDPNDEYRFDEAAIGGQFSAAPANFANSAKAPASLSLIPSSTALEMLIEQAQTSQITSEDLWRALQVIPPSLNPANRTVASTALTVTLAPVSQPAPATGWHLARRVELERQAWRWMGRPPIGLPPAPVQPTEINGLTPPIAIPQGNGWGRSDAMNTALNWESYEFAERTDSPTTTNASVFFTPPVAADGSLSQTIYSHDLSSDIRAQYFRFSALLYSRYEGLPNFLPFGQGNAILSQINFGKVTGDGNKLDGYTPWVRGFVPCRISPPAPAAIVDLALPPPTLPKPKILICLPLTAPVEPPDALIDPATKDKRGHTSLLVITDEQWHQVAGLAELMEAAIDEVSISPGVYSVTAPGVTAPQIGPDPIIYTSAFPAGVKPGTPWLGRPVGTTFDNASTTPLLANTGLQFQMPQIAGIGPLDWYMAKLKFRRSARNSMLLGADPRVDDDTPVLVSSYTDSTWIEFLPSSDHFATTDNLSVFVGDLTFAFDPNNNNALIFTNSPSDAGPATVTPRSGPFDLAAAQAKLELWAVMMQSITDAGGIPGELYVGHCCLYPPQPYTVQNPDLVNHLYLVEVQRSPAAPFPLPAQPAGTWLNDLYPGSSKYQPAPAPQFASAGEPDATMDVLYRVVRMSDRVQRSSM